MRGKECYNYPMYIGSSRTQVGDRAGQLTNHLFFAIPRFSKRWLTKFFPKHFLSTRQAHSFVRYSPPTRLIVPGSGPITRPRIIPRRSTPTPTYRHQSDTHRRQVHTIPTNLPRISTLHLRSRTRGSTPAAWIAAREIQPTPGSSVFSRISRTIEPYNRGSGGLCT